MALQAPWAYIRLIAMSKNKGNKMFDISRVQSTYSGRKGCACGCRGKYTYGSAHAGARPSYVTGDEGISDRSVKATVSKIEKMLHDPHSEIAKVTVHGDSWLAVDMQHDRTYTIYFAEDEAAVEAEQIAEELADKMQRRGVAPRYQGDPAAEGLAALRADNARLRQRELMARYEGAGAPLSEPEMNELRTLINRKD